MRTGSCSRIPGSAPGHTPEPAREAASIGDPESPPAVDNDLLAEIDAIACVLELSHGAVATSACYERGTHIIDPTTRRAPDGVLSVTVLGPDLTSADTYATATFAMGPAGPAWSGTLADYETMTILDDGRVLCRPGFVAHCPGGSVAPSLDSAA